MSLGFIKGVGLQAITKKPDEIFTPAVQLAIKARSLEHASLAVNTTQEQLQRDLDISETEGFSIGQVSKEIDTLYGESMGYRSTRIARTELTNVINDGALRTLHAEGWTKKEWRTVLDGRSRKSHQAMNGIVVDVLSPFHIPDYGGGGGTCQAPAATSLPAGELINCRCTIVGAGVPVERKKELDKMFIRLHGMLEKNFVVQLRRAFQEQRNRVLSHFPS